MARVELSELHDHGNLSGKQNPIPEIQSLRAVAVLLVMIYHSDSKLLPGGYIGVDVFFVISGFLISSLLIRELDSNGNIDFFNFYAKRARRLLPASIFVTLTTLFGCWIIYSPLELKYFTATVVATLSYLSNMLFAYYSTDYLASGTESNPLLHTWSLSVEEQFYLFWPLLLFLLNTSLDQNRRYQRTFVGLIAVFAVSLSACIIVTNTNQPWAFFGSPFRAWEFAVGGILAVLRNRTIRLHPSIDRIDSSFLKVACIVSGLLIVGYSGLKFDGQTAFPGYRALIPVFGASLVIIGALISKRSAATDWLSVRPLKYIGDISYSLYLWHWPISIFLKEWSLSPAAHSATYYISSFILAACTYHFLENPMRHNRFLVSNHKRSIAALVSVTCLAVLATYVARLATIDELGTDEQVRFRQAASDIPRIYRNGCHLDFKATELPPCRFGATVPHKTMVLFGDSHAAHWFPAFEKIAEEEGFQLLSMTKSNCPSANFNTSIGLEKRPYPECSIWRERAFSKIKELRPDVVVVSNYAQLDHMQQFANASVETLERLRPIAGQILVLRDTPRLGFNAPNCLSRAAWRAKSIAAECSFKVEPMHDSEIFLSVKDQLGNAPNVRHVDMLDAFCKAGQICQVDRHGIVLFYDSHHLTTAFSRSLSDLIKEKAQLTVAVDL